MYGRRHLQFMKVSNQEVEIRVHYSQQDNWIIPAPTLVRAGEGKEGEKRQGISCMNLRHQFWSSWNVPSLLCFGFFHCAYVVQVWLWNYRKADPHTTTPTVFWESSWLNTLRVSGPGIRNCQTDKVLSLLWRDCLLLSVLKAQDSGGLSLPSMILLKAYKFFSLFFIFSIICIVTSGTDLAEAMRKPLNDPKLYFHDSHVSKIPNQLSVF